MYKDNKLVFYSGLIISLVLLTLYYSSQQTTKIVSFDSNSFFCILLLGLLILICIKRKKRVRVAIGTILGLASYTSWFSVVPLTGYNNNIIQGEQRITALLLWCFAVLILISISSKAGKRRQFAKLVKRKVIQKQKNRCANCKRKLGPYGLDFHHANGDRSDNIFSNCKALCIPCHRRKHAQ
jgi:peptidoglycan/LPS O-acetylase OafA/YrhL